MKVYELTVSNGKIIICRETDKPYTSFINVNKKGNGDLLIMALNRDNAINYGQIVIKTHRPVKGYELKPS